MPVPCLTIFVPRARARAYSDRAVPCRAQLIPCQNRARAGFFRAVPVPCRAGKARLTPLDVDLGVGQTKRVWVGMKGWGGGELFPKKYELF